MTRGISADEAKVIESAGPAVLRHAQLRTVLCWCGGLTRGSTIEFSPDFPRRARDSWVSDGRPRGCGRGVCRDGQLSAAVAWWAGGQAAADCRVLTWLTDDR